MSSIASSGVTAVMGTILPGPVAWRAMTRSIGVDAFDRGWVAVELDAAGLFAAAWPARTLAALLEDVPATAAVGVDIPIGGVESGWRDADLVARARLGRRASTVFLVPPRGVWALESYDAANTELRRRSGSGLARQSFHLFRKMLEAEAERDRHDLFEVHPEVVFAAMAGAPLVTKNSWAGLIRRRALLREVGIALPDDLGPAGVVPSDDVLDAAAVAWCAYRRGRGDASHLPDPVTQVDERGLPIVIWFTGR
jgi:predicted RNase H-like nuclease